MPQRAFYIFILIVTVGSQTLSAQNYFYMPAIQQLYHTSAVISPSTCQDKKIDLLAGSHSYSPPFANVGSLYFLGSVGMQADTSGALLLWRHRIGMIVCREKEGEYLSRFRGYISYSLSLNISEHWSLTAGIYGGLYQYFVGSTISTGSQKATAADATLGGTIRNRNLEFTISSNQLLSSRLKGDLSESYLRRTLNVLIKYRIQWRPRLRQDFYAWYSKGDVNSTFLNVHSNVWFGDFIYAGAGVRTHNSGMLYALGIRNSNEAKHQITLAGSYYVPFRNKVTYASPQLEFNVLYLLK